MIGFISSICSCNIIQSLCLIHSLVITLPTITSGSETCEGGIVLLFVMKWKCGTPTRAEHRHRQFLSLQNKSPPKVILYLACWFGFVCLNFKIVTPIVFILSISLGVSSIVVVFHPCISWKDRVGRRKTTVCSSAHFIASENMVGDKKVPDESLILFS